MILINFDLNHTCKVSQLYLARLSGKAGFGPFPTFYPPTTVTLARITPILELSLHSEVQLQTCNV